MFHFKFEGTMNNGKDVTGSDFKFIYVTKPVKYDGPLSLMALDLHGLSKQLERKFLRGKGESYRSQMQTIGRTQSLD